jgi:hypothetical protein
MLLLNTSAAAATRPYPSLGAATHRDRVLIVAPHIDDESISSAGYAIDAMERGADVYVVFLTAGDCNRISARLLHKTFDPTASNYLSVAKRMRRCTFSGFRRITCSFSAIPIAACARCSTIRTQW